MSRATLRRTVRFRATHHYGHSHRTAAENREAWGRLADPHPHDYAVTVWIEGEAEPATGFVVDLTALDERLERLLGPLRGADLNRVVPPVADGESQPSCEALARWAFDLLTADLPDGARLVRLQWDESPDLGASVVAG